MRVVCGRLLVDYCRQLMVDCVLCVGVVRSVMSCVSSCVLWLVYVVCCEMGVVVFIWFVLCVVGVSMRIGLLCVWMIWLLCIICGWVCQMSAVSVCCVLTDEVCLMRV